MFYLDLPDPDPVLLSRECIATLSCFFPLVRIFTNLSATKHCLTANQENKFALSPKQRVRSRAPRGLQPLTLTLLLLFNHPPNFPFHTPLVKVLVAEPRWSVCLPIPASDAAKSSDHCGISSVTVSRFPVHSLPCQAWSLEWTDCSPPEPLLPSQNSWLQSQSLGLLYSVWTEESISPELILVWEPWNHNKMGPATCPGILAAVS